MTRGPRVQSHMLSQVVMSWVTSDILELIYKRDKTLKLANKNISMKELREQYIELRNIVTDKVREAKANYCQTK